MIVPALKVGAEIYIVTPLDGGQWAVDEVHVINDDGNTIACTSTIYDRGVMFVGHEDAFVSHTAATEAAIKRNTEKKPT